MYPTKLSNEIAVVLRDPKREHGLLMKQALREGRRLFLVVRKSKPAKNPDYETDQPTEI